MITVNGIEITEDTIIATRNHFVDIHNKCIEQALSGEVRVNDIERYVKDEQAKIIHTLNGSGDHTLTFLQRALWIQTGQCVPLLS